MNPDARRCEKGGTTEEVTLGWTLAERVNYNGWAVADRQYLGHDICPKCNSVFEWIAAVRAVRQQEACHACGHHYMVRELDSDRCLECGTPLVDDTAA